MVNVLHIYNHTNIIQRGAIVVHCSAGIGRSGAIIVIDMICDQIRKHGINFDIEIQKTVMHCRDHRPGMVQTEAQYAFIYKGRVYENLELLKEIHTDTVASVFCTVL